MIGISKFKSTSSHPLVMKLVLLALLYSVQQQTICSAGPIPVESDPSTLLELFNEIDEPPSPDVNIEVGKRAPWAPSEIRYDAFVQKLLAGKTRLYSSRDKHSYERDDNHLERSGRSWSPPESEMGTNKRLDQIHKLLKQIEKEVEDILSISKADKNRLEEHESRADSSAADAAMLEENSLSEFREANRPIRNSSSSAVKLLEDVLIEVSQRLQQRSRQNQKQFQDQRLPQDLQNRQPSEDYEYNDLALKSYLNYDLGGSSGPESSNIESSSEAVRSSESKTDFSSLTVDRWIELLKRESDRRRVENQRFESRLHSKSRRKRNHGVGLGREALREALDSLLSPPIQRNLENNKRIERDPTNSAMNFIG